MSRNRSFPGRRLLLYLGGLLGLFRAAEQSLDEAGAPVEPLDPSSVAQPENVNAIATLLTGLGVLIVLWIIVVVLYPLFAYFVRERIATSTPPVTKFERPILPPEPRIQSNPRQDLNGFQANEQADLANYRWVDRSKGIVSMPIEQAIQIVARRGVPPSKPGDKDYYKPQAGTRETGFEGKVEPEPR